MIAGGIGAIESIHTHKHPIEDGDLLIQLGGPGMRIGMGGGTASSMSTGANTEIWILILYNVVIQRLSVVRKR